jgi:N-carbamoyl-L-amino-acid hydrolase
VAGAGRAPLGPDPEALRRIGTFVELHVEQGRALADLGRAVAVGTAIHPHGRWRIDLAGRADHAGTTRIVDRDDPMLAFARIVLAARAAAERHGAVATCGKVRVAPNGVNAIPSHVTAWLDARGEDAERVRAVVADVSAIGGVVTEESWTDRTAFDQELARRLAVRLDDAPLLPTGAGHDAGILAAAGIPTAMLYVRNPTGVSHSPEEHADDDDCVAGVTALTAVLRELTA